VWRQAGRRRIDDRGGRVGGRAHPDGNAWAPATFPSIVTG
jgi:hypothetical protein